MTTTSNAYSLQEAFHNNVILESSQELMWLFYKTDKGITSLPASQSSYEGDQNRQALG